MIIIEKKISNIKKMSHQNCEKIHRVNRKKIQKFFSNEWID